VITNDKGRLSKEEIEQMLRDAEEFAEQDKLLKEKIDAKNSLENYVYSMKNTVEDPTKLADKLEDSEKETIKEALEETRTWLEGNDDATKEEYEEKLKELEGVCNPIISKVYQAGGAEGQ
jgi:endoplasmic reticulum chaperone BiP